jgi:hypothetical protein
VTYVIEHTQAIAELQQGGVLYASSWVINEKSANIYRDVSYIRVLVIEEETALTNFRPRASNNHILWTNLVESR